MELNDSKPFLKIKKERSSDNDVKGSVKKVELKLDNNKKDSQKKEKKCDQCPKSFDFQNDLARHKMTHSNKRPFKCETCGSDFKLKGNLAEHQKLHTCFTDFIFKKWNPLILNHS